VSQKSAAGAPVPSAKGPRRAQTGFRWSTRSKPGREKRGERLGGRSAGVKTEIADNITSIGSRDHVVRATPCDRSQAEELKLLIQ
jgi:hypothetical protein